MKKILKALGIAAIAAAVIPCKVEKDELTGERTYQSLLSRLRVGPGGNGEGADVRLDLLGGVLPTALGRSEADDLDSGELDLDGEPVFGMTLKVEREAPAGEEARTAADEAQTIANQAQAAADEAQAAAGKAQEEAERAQEEAERAREKADAAAEAAREEAEKHGFDL